MGEAIDRLPARPPSEVEWEDLLLRMELMARALRSTVEDADLSRVRDELGALVEREERVREWLERHALDPASRRGTENAANLRDETTWGSAELVERAVSLRARNFAMVQRRGLGVWEWSGDLDVDGGRSLTVTAFQLLGWLVGEDVRTLAALRAGTRGTGAPAC